MRHYVVNTRVLLALSTLLFIIPAASASLVFSEVQNATTADIVKKLTTHHYRDLPLDDQLSSGYLDQLLDSFDPAKSYFLAADVQEFEQFRNRIDDQLLQGRLDAGVFIYERFRQRADARLQWIIAELKNPDTPFDFSADETLPLDAEDETWATDAAQADELWRKRLKAGVLSLKLAGKPVDEARKILTKRYTNQLKRLQEQESAEIYETLINALTLLFDPHTNYLSPRTEENFQISMSLSLEGIGAVLQADEEFTKVVRLITAGPAEKQGELKPADRIIGVGQGSDGEIVDVIGWRLDEVVDRIRGDRDTVVRLEVIPANAVDDTVRKVIQIKREKVKLEDQAAQKAVIELSDGKDTYKLGIIRIPTFYMDFDAYKKRDPNFKSTTRDVMILLEQLEREGIDGLILDLRNNGGGSLQEATMLTDLFIDEGPVVQIRQSNETISRHSRARMPALYRGPMVVLINRLSASASEIFAGAIQDYNRGLIVGSQSFGKGTVQALTDVPQGQLKITESKFYRVSGDSTQHRGVVPDVELPSLINPKDVGESTYDTALPWDQIHEVSHSKYFNFSTILPNLMQLHQQRAANDPDIRNLLEQMKLFDQLKEKKVISLNERTRIAEQEQLEQAQFELANRHRVAKGMEPFASLAAYKADSEAEAETLEGPDGNKIDVPNDPLLHETGYILLDMMKLMRRTAPSEVANF